MHKATKRLVNAPPLSELAVVLRHLGGVQSQVSELVRQQQQEIDQLQGQLIRLRAQRVLERTQNFWGLSKSPRGTHPANSREVGTVSGITSPSLKAKAWQAAQKIICLTGCAGHAHPWLNPDGQCARTGQECDVQEMPRVG